MKLPGNRWTLVGVAICLLGLLSLVGRAEFVHQTRPRWQFDVEGYDPRDFLRGRYLDLRYKLRWEGEDTCGVPAPEWAPDCRLDPMCCLCLTRSGTAGATPSVRQASCDEAETRCDGWVRSEDMLPPIQYFIPEDRALQLEDAVREHNTSIEIVVDPGGHPALVELRLDGVPWRDAL